MTMISRSTILFGVLAVLLILGCGDPPSDSDPSSSSGAAGSVTVHHHDESGETCFICDESKREPGRLWCTEHARYEDRCWLCQPQLEEKGRLWCEEHSLYEDECFLCHPQLEDGGPQEQEPTSHAGHGLFCNEHQVVEAECGICQPQLAAGLMPGGELKIRFESAQSAAKAGIRTSPARAAAAQASVRAYCEVEYNGNSLARVTPFASGIVRKVLVDVGQEVEEGEILMELHSSTAATAKAAYVAALVDYDLKRQVSEREHLLAKKDISSEREVQEADAAFQTAEVQLRTAQQVLLNYGFTEAEVDSIRENQDTTATLYLRAPFRGTLVERDVVVGEAVEPGRRLFLLADLETMWLSLSIPFEQARHLRDGLLVEAEFPGSAGETVRGEVDWVNTSIDERSRMVQARAVVDNTARSLSAGSFGDAVLFVAEAQDSVEIAKDALQRYEGGTYVFVEIEDDLYSLRRVTTVEGQSGDSVAVLAGLRSGEPVVTTGAFTVMSEFLKSRLGAGCVDD
ncbi:MAG: efflux transporter periplasmic adaptor subunit [Planctomycetes bacterium]|nr:efflux transporter periplasmic adaptor subunit [Planctomycetota bacterium]